MKKICGAVLVLFLVFLIPSLFVVKQIEQCIVMRFGEPVRVINQPGLNFKIPLVEEVYYFDKRLLEIELSALEVTLKDRRRVVVDAFGRYKIVDPLLFYQTVRNEYGVKRRLSAIVLGSLRSVLGNLNLPDLLSDARQNVMKSIKDDVNTNAGKFGISMVDVRIRRTDLPKQNSEAVFARMISEREREAKELRAKGEEQSRIIRSEADKESVIKLAEASKQAQILLGEGEAIASKKYAEAFSVDIKFFEFYGLLNIYSNALAKSGNKIILTPDVEILNLIKKFPKN